MLLRRRRGYAADDETEEQEKLLDERGDPLRTPATLDEDSETPDSALEDKGRIFVLLAKDVGKGEEDVVRQLAVEPGG